MATTLTLKDVLTRLTTEGELYEKLPDNRLRCYACGHRCLIPEGRPGVCKVRFNEAGLLKVPAGYAGARDPRGRDPAPPGQPGGAGRNGPGDGVGLRGQHLQRAPHRQRVGRG